MSTRRPSHPPGSIAAKTGKPTPSLDSFRDAIVASLPALSGAEFRNLNGGWDSVAIDADGQWIFKFPHEPAAEARLRREYRIVAAYGRISTGPDDMVLGYFDGHGSDLTLRVIARYERITSRSIDRDRVTLYSAMYRLVEFAEALPDRADLPARLRAVREWVALSR